MAAGCQWAATTPPWTTSQHRAATQASPAADSQPLCTAAHRVQRQYTTADTSVMGQTALLCTLGVGPMCTKEGGDVSKRMYSFPWQAPALPSLQHQLGALVACALWALLCLGVPCRLCARRCWADLQPLRCTWRAQHVGTPRRTASSLSRATQSPSRTGTCPAATWPLGRGVYCTPYCLS
jgi:hypothetical protein